MVEAPSTIEQDIAELERQLEAKKATLEHDKSEKDIIHDIVGEKISRLKESRILDSQGESGQTISPHITEPPSYLSQELKDKIQQIISIVFSKNLEEGIKEAAKSSNPALIDAFHDILVDELYNQLIEKGKIQKVD